MNRNQVNLCDWLGSDSVSEFKSEDQIREYFSIPNLRKMFGKDANISEREIALNQCLAEWK